MTERDCRMARKVDSYLVDDFDGTRPAKTRTFSVDGVDYEIDLAEQNEKQFQEDMERYMEAGRRVGKRGGVGRSPQRHARLQAAREWLRAQGHEIGNKGRIPKNLLDKYDEAHPSGSFQRNGMS